MKLGKCLIIEVFIWIGFSGLAHGGWYLADILHHFCWKDFEWWDWLSQIFFLHNCIGKLHLFEGDSELGMVFFPENIDFLYLRLWRHFQTLVLILYSVLKALILSYFHSIFTSCVFTTGVLWLSRLQCYKSNHLRFQLELYSAVTFVDRFTYTLDQILSFKATCTQNWVPTHLN